MILVAELVLDSGTLYYSETGITTIGRFYEPRLLSISDVGREIPVVPGQFTAVTASVTLDNADYTFSKLRSTERLRRRTCNILIGEEGAGLSAFTTIFSGVISNWSASGARFTLDLEETLLTRIDAPLPGAVTRDLFPHLPDETQIEFVPLVVGQVSAMLGAIEAYRIDPATGQAKFRYLACQTDVKEITEVYIYGVEQSSGFAIATLGGVLPDGVTVIDFDADPLDLDRQAEIEVTFNAIGLTDDKTSSGNAVSNPVDQVRELWEFQGFSAALVDSTIFDATATLVDNRGFTSGFAEVDAGRTFREVLERFAESFNLSFYTTPLGKLGVAFPEPEPPSSSGLVRLTDTVEILGGSFKAVGPSEVASNATAQHNLDWARGTWEETAFTEDAGQVAALGESLALPVAQLYYVRDSAVRFGVISDRLFFAQEGREVVEIKTRLDEITSILTLGDNVLVTHHGGVASDGKGYRDAVFRIVAQSIALTEESASQSLRLVSLSAALFEPSLEYLDQKPIQLRYRHNRHEMFGARNLGRMIA